MRLTRESGFSLIEILIVMGVMSLGSLAVMWVTSKMFRESEVSRGNLAVKDVMEDIHLLLNDQATCERNFRGNSVTSPPSFNRLTDASGGPVYVVNNSYEGSTVRVLGLSLSDYTSLDPQSGRISLNVRIRNNLAPRGSQDLLRVVPLSVILDASSRIEQCRTGTGLIGNSAELCEEFGGRFVAGATPPDNRCIFSRYVATTDPNLVPDANALVHVRGDTNSDGIFEDLFSVMRSGLVLLNRPISTTPTDPALRFSANGDASVSGSLISGTVRARQVVIAPMSQWSNPTIANPPTSAQSGAPQILMYGTSSDTGYTGLGGRNGALFFDGGSEGGVGIFNSSSLPNGGFEFNHNKTMSPVDPFPGNALPVRTPSLVLRNSGGAGVGYSLSTPNAVGFPQLPPIGGPSLAITPIGPSATAGTINYGSPTSNVRFFVKKSMIIEEDLYAPGGISALAGVGVASDERWKEDIQPLSETLSKIFSISGVRYGWKKQAPRRVHEADREVGFIAQDVEQHFPEAVTTDAAGYKLVSYTKLLPVLWQAFKDALNETDTLEQEMIGIERLFCRDHPAEEICLRSSKGGDL